MRERILIVLLTLLGSGIFSQEEIRVCPVTSLNTKGDDIVASYTLGTLIYMGCEKTDLINDYRWSAPPPFRLYAAQRGNTFADWIPQGKMDVCKSRNDIGPASVDPADSLLYFSTVDNFKGGRGKHLKIYSCKMTESGWSEPELLPFCSDDADYAHPWFDPSQQLLVFSSNRQGGQGKMDLWFVYRMDLGWGEPVNFGEMINTPYNEAFPSSYLGDIYYASDAPGGLGGYDLRKAVRTDQWKSYVNLPAPYNSSADDIHVVFLSDEKALFTSNRDGGQGGDDIYLAEKIFPAEERSDYTAILECLGQAKDNIEIAFTNESGELFMRQKTDSAGYLDISALRMNRSYRLQLSGIDPSQYSDCVLSIFDAKGHKIRELRFNANGFADLELLPLSYSALELLPLEDQSLLAIQIEGQLFDEQPGDVGKDEPVTILDEDGNPVAIAFTNDIGKFRFSKVKPQMDYTFRLSPETSASQVIITDKGEKIVLPILNAEINYRRINPEDAIELVNEYNEKIIVSTKDLFVINRIYYEYNSSNLTEESRRQLDQLRIILERNASVGLELRSHTDSRGKDDYNLQLSKKRARSAADYIAGKKLRRERIKEEGFGETMLINECEDGISCTEPEHAINRRTEIRLIKLPDAR